MTAFVVTPVEAFLLSQGKAHLAGTHGLCCSVLEPVIDVSAYCCCPELSLFNSLQNGECNPRKLWSGSWRAFSFCVFFMNTEELGGKFKIWIRVFNPIQIKIKIILFARIDMLIETISYLKVGSGSARLKKGKLPRHLLSCILSVASIIHITKCLLIHPQPTLRDIRRLYSPFPFIQKFGIAEFFTKSPYIYVLRNSD